MNVDGKTESEGELHLLFANGSIRPIRRSRNVGALRHRHVMAFTCALAVILAIPSNGSFSDHVPLLARVTLNLCSVALFTLLFPALLLEVATWAQRYRLRFVFEPLITLSAAIITTLAIESLANLMVGHSQETRLDTLTKLGFGMLFWGLHIMTILQFVMPAMRETASDRPQVRPPLPPTGVMQVQIGRHMFNPSAVDRVMADDHFLTVFGAFGTTRTHGAMSKTEDVLRDLGMLVHRSHWVAYRELGPIRQNGRGLLMLTKSGASVPVARSRRTQVEEATQGRESA